MEIFKGGELGPLSSRDQQANAQPCNTRGSCDSHGFKHRPHDRTLSRPRTGNPTQEKECGSSCNAGNLCHFWGEERKRGRQVSSPRRSPRCPSSMRGRRERLSYPPGLLRMQPHPRTSGWYGDHSGGRHGLHRGLPLERSERSGSSISFATALSGLWRISAARSSASTLASSLSDSRSRKTPAIIDTVAAIAAVAPARRMTSLDWVPATIPANRPKIETVPSDIQKTISLKDS